MSLSRDDWILNYDRELTTMIFFLPFFFLETTGNWLRWYCVRAVPTGEAERSCDFGVGVECSGDMVRRVCVSY